MEFLCVSQQGGFKNMSKTFYPKKEGGKGGGGGGSVNFTQTFFLKFFFVFDPIGGKKKPKKN
jgi:hypothetical protein